MKKILCILMAVCVIFCTACTRPAEVETGKETTEEQKPVSVTLYFSDMQAISLVAEEREVYTYDKSLAETVLFELLKGPENKDLIGLVPPGTSLNSVTVEDKLCTVDFGPEFIDKAPVGTTAITLLVYSIVNTLTQLDNIEEVQFLIGGEKVEVFGNFIFSEPFVSDETLNKQRGY